jgi:hypothetical protein
MGDRFDCLESAKNGIIPKKISNVYFMNSIVGYDGSNVPQKQSF